MTQAEFDALLNGNTNFAALTWRVEALLNNRTAVAGGPTTNEVNQLQTSLAKLQSAVTALGNVASLQPVLDAIAVLKTELDTVKAKTDKDLA